MLLHIVARGRMGRCPEAELIERYTKRMTRPLRITELAERGGAEPGLLRPGRRIILDESGASLCSVDLATLLGCWRDEGVREARFAIGGADGFSPAERDGADLLLSFGRLTWPHMLARAMLVEQLYRAEAILANHPYHREG